MFIKIIQLCTLSLMLLILASCSDLTPKEPGIGKAINWSTLPGWHQDNLTKSWPALIHQCPKLAAKQATWTEICHAAAALKDPTGSQVRQFIQNHFEPHEILGSNGQPDGLITGYYEPTLHGSYTKDSRYNQPIYGKPDTLLTIDLADLYPELKGKRVRGRLIGNRVVPYFSRAGIDGAEHPLQGNELLWVDNPYDAFFLQVQGSGRVQLPNGTLIGVGYADQNGHPYISIGKRLIEMGELTRDEVSLFTIRRWLEANPDKAMDLLNQNPSYVFFALKKDVENGPRGSLNVPLTTERSLAVDRSIIPLGTPVWLATTLPDNSSYQRLMFAQDTGGAIAGAVRADVFFGNGDRAEQLAGTMKQPGRLYALLPKKNEP